MSDEANRRDLTRIVRNVRVRWLAVLERDVCRMDHDSRRTLVDVHRLGRNRSRFIGAMGQEPVGPADAGRAAHIVRICWRIARRRRRSNRVRSASKPLILVNALTVEAES